MVAWFLATAAWYHPVERLNQQEAGCYRVYGAVVPLGADQSTVYSGERAVSAMFAACMRAVRDYRWSPCSGSRVHARSGQTESHSRSRRGTGGKLRLELYLLKLFSPL